MRVKRLTALLLIASLSACASRPLVDSGPSRGSAVPTTLPADPVPRAEPLSRYGNGPVYEVFGQPYRVLDTSYGYIERGVASWYGRKFHGRKTSSQEPYDMHQMTAAHKTLPLPTYVRVRNLSNNKTVVVRVNDRGPFVDNRIIDLSYAAARRLDMVEDGTSLVEVTAISFDRPPPASTNTVTDADSANSGIPAEDGTSLVDVTAISFDRPPPASTNTVTDADSANSGIPAGDTVENGVFLQVGAFGDRNNADRRFQLLHGNGVRNAFILVEEGPEMPLYRVRVGPIVGADQYDALLALLTEIGIPESHVISD